MAPTKKELETQLSGLVMQRSQFKDQIEQIERMMSVVQGQLQLLAAQEEDKVETD